MRFILTETLEGSIVNASGRQQAFVLPEGVYNIINPIYMQKDFMVIHLYVYDSKNWRTGEPERQINTFYRNFGERPVNDFFFTHAYGMWYGVRKQAPCVLVPHILDGRPNV